MTYNQISNTQQRPAPTSAQRNIPQEIEEINIGAGNESNSAPIKNFDISGGIRVSVWENDAKTASGNPYKRVSVTLQKSYKDKDGKYQRTGSLSINDLPRVVEGIGQAYSWLITRTTNEEEQ